MQRLFRRLAFALRRLRSRDPVCYRRLPHPPLWGGQHGLPVKAIDWLFHTNSYGLTGRFLSRGPDIAEVVDHLHATAQFLDHRLGIGSLPTRVLSATNTHPCSATRYALPVSRKGLRRVLRYRIKRVVAAECGQKVPDELDWLRPLIETADSAWGAGQWRPGVGAQGCEPPLGRACPLRLHPP